MKITLNKSGTTRINDDGTTFSNSDRKLEVWNDGKTIWYNAPCSDVYSDELWAKTQESDFSISFEVTEFGPGSIYISSEPKFIGAFPIRNELAILPEKK